MIGALFDADARSDLNVSWEKAVLADPESGIGRSEIASVIVGAGYPEGLCEASGASGEFWEITRCLGDNSSSSCHFCNTRERFEGAEKYRTCLLLSFTGDVQAVVIAVDEIDVGVARGAKEDCIARSDAGGGVSGGIVFSEVGLDFNDAGCQAQVFAVTNEYLAEEFASHAARSTGEESAINWENRPEADRENHISGCRREEGKVKM